MIVSSPKCDTTGCLLERTATNHWFVVRLLDDHKELWEWEKAEAKGFLNEATAYHFCGQTHALQFVSQTIGRL